MMRKLQLLWSFPAAIIIRIISPIILVKTVGIRSGYIGHFISESVEQIHLMESRKKTNKAIRRPTFRLYYFRTMPTINSFLEHKVRQNLSISKIGKAIAHAQELLPNSAKYKDVSTANAGRFLARLDGEKIEGFNFTQAEDETAREWLRSIGWQDNQPIICLLVRDSAFYNYGENSENKTWEFTKFRDSNIENYRLGVDFLLAQGFFVIRMGLKMRIPLVIQHKSFFDYAFSEQQSPFLDVWLFSKCQGIISTGTGPDLLGPINSIPVLMLNALPLYGVWSFASVLWFPKHLSNVKSGKKLTLNEHLDSTFNTYNEYVENEIAIQEMSPLEIEAACKEFYNLFFAHDEPKLQSSEKQDLFWAVFSNHERFLIDHSKVNPHAYIGESWLDTQDHEFLT